MKVVHPLLALVVASLLVGACGASATGQTVATLRLGYFPNVTHGTAILGVADGTFAQSLGTTAKLEAHTFNAGPEAIEALFANAVDATFIGPSPAINAYIKSGGQAVRIVAGATSGGAFLVVRDGINAAADLAGKKIASPQLGNTQDVALRAWLASQGLATDAQGGGDVTIMPQSNSQTLQTFKSTQIDGAWVPEPWATQLINAGGHVLVDERTLWPGGQYVTTLLLVSTTFLQAHPEVVKALLKGELAATDNANAHPAQAQAVVGSEIARITGSAMPADVVAQSWGNLTFTVDPIAGSLQKSADEAKQLGFIETSDLAGIFDLSLLNGVLSDAGRPTIPTP